MMAKILLAGLLYSAMPGHAMADVLQYHNDAARSGAYPQAGVSAAGARRSEPNYDCRCKSRRSRHTC